ncbi:uncharacterized protein LOC133873717 [Alnus glutinosa]|uniref:uncharacterized protein LOC133873717 n=1 Tax=Alnus glutinosa TaxID=3517 RepID=UPI002D7909D4|nr:uncharacterized protein LOC133873717 [Alnus glutinosa]
MALSQRSRLNSVSARGVILHVCQLPTHFLPQTAQTIFPPNRFPPSIHLLPQPHRPPPSTTHNPATGTSSSISGFPAKSHRAFSIESADPTKSLHRAFSISGQRTYAKQQSFEVVQKNKRKHASGYTCYITLSCARQGSRKASSSKHVQTTRMEYVTSVSTKHNHDLSPDKARYFRCNKNLDFTGKRKLLINDRAGICMSKSYNSLAVEAGGYEHLAFGEKRLS